MKHRCGADESSPPDTDGLPRGFTRGVNIMSGIGL
jgi:hypothetical protein